MSCHCDEGTMDTWDKRTDVPQYGRAYIAMRADMAFPELRSDNRTVDVNLVLRFVGQPPNMHGGGVYRVEKTFGFDHLLGKMFSCGYDRIVALVDTDNAERVEETYIK